MMYKLKYKKKLRSIDRYSEYNYISLEDVMPLTYEGAM